MRFPKNQVHTAQKQSRNGKILVRAFTYIDPYMGYGQGATKAYFEIQPDKDLVQDPWDNWYKLTPEKIDQIEKAFNRDFFIDHGVDVITYQERQAELEKMNREIQAIQERTASLAKINDL